MGKPKAPPPPNYAALAQAQGQANIDSAIFNTNSNRANQYGPDGSVTWELAPGADPRNPRPGDYIQRTSLSPEQQRLYDAQTNISQSFVDTAQQGLERVGSALGTSFDTSVLPGRRTAPGVQQNAQAAQFGPVDDASRSRVEQAMLSRLEPQFQQDEAAMDAKLLNSGIEKGSEAYNREMTRLDRSRNDARMQAVLAGGAEESRQRGLGASLQGQEFGQQQSIDGLLNAYGLSSAGFDNTARSQAMEEQAYLRTLPINETNALRTGAQVSMPQFGGYYTGGNAGAAPVFDAGVAQGNYDMSRYQNQLSGYNALIGGLAGMGGAFLGRPPGP